MRRGLKCIGIGAAIGGGAVLAFAFLVDWIAPPDLTRGEQLSTVVEDRDGNMLRAFLSADDKWRLQATIADVDPLFLKLLVAYEDQRFADHFGVDPLAAGRAMWQLLANMRVVSGASTLTMQVVRLLEPRPRNIFSKGIEVFRALEMEARYSKDEILSFYLTLAPYGGNIEGVRAASLAYFGKEPKHLTLAQAALLVALPQSPERQRPDRHAEDARAARDRVLARLAERGVIAWEAAKEAMEEDVPSARLAFPFRAPHLAEHLYGSASGSVVVTTIDGRIQRAVEELAAREREFFPDPADMAVVVVDNATREVLAYLGSSDFWGPQGQLDLARARRSPGSALKPFIYGIAFDDLGVHPATLIEDKLTLFGDYAPRNFSGGYHGTISIRTALQASLNTPAVALLDRIGPARFTATLRNAGAELAFAKRWAAPSLPIALGGAGVTLSDLTALYAAIPNGGVAKPLRFTLDAPETQGVRLFGETAAWYLTDILAGSPLPDGYAMGRGIERPRRIAFKTGTSYGYRDAWSAGFSARYTVGVWVGRADGSTRPGHFGRNDAAPLLLKIFDLLPPEPNVKPAVPEGVIMADRAEELPRAMQRFVAREILAPGVKREPGPPRIVFPPDGATVALPGPEEDDTIVLKAQGGVGPLRWLVNGEMLPAAAKYEQTLWTPDGEGFARITVVDAAGRSSTAVVRFAPGPGG